MSLQPRLLIFFIILFIACVFIWTEIFLYSQNTLFENGNWVVEKRMLQMNVFGSDSYLITRASLAGNILHLGAWHAFQKVRLWRELKPAEIRFSFRLADQAYLCLLLGETANGSAGLRLSRNPNHRSAYFEVTHQGKFTTLQILPRVTITSGWHQAIVTFSNRTLIARIDNKEITRSDTSLPFRGQIGFRGGSNDADIDDLRIRSEGGDEFKDSFSNPKHFFPVALLNASFLLVLFALLICFELVRWRRIDLHRAFLKGSAFALVGIVLGLLYFAFDFFNWSRLYLDILSKPTASEAQRISQRNFEWLRYWTTSNWYRIGGGTEITKRSVADLGYPDQLSAGPILCVPELPECRYLRNKELKQAIRKNANYRILFIGTSQTVGAGADRLEDTFFVRIHHSLKDNLAPIPVESLNMSVSASNSIRLLDDYQKTYLAFEPDLVVINLSNNDKEADFERGISGFLEINKKDGILTILLQEANSDEVNTQSLVYKHSILSSLGSKYGVEVIKLHSFFQDPAIRDQGFLWWDLCHLTSYGQQCLAQWLAPQLLGIIRTQSSYKALKVGAKFAEAGSDTGKCPGGRDDEHEVLSALRRKNFTQMGRMSYMCSTGSNRA